MIWALSLLVVYVGNKSCRDTTPRKENQTDRKVEISWKPGLDRGGLGFRV